MIEYQLKRIQRIKLATGVPPTVLDVSREEFELLCEDLFPSRDGQPRQFLSNQVELAGVRIVCVEPA